MYCFWYWTGIIQDMRGWTSGVWVLSVYFLQFYVYLFQNRKFQKRVTLNLMNTKKKLLWHLSTCFWSKSLKLTLIVIILLFYFTKHPVSPEVMMTTVAFWNLSWNYVVTTASHVICVLLRLFNFCLIKVFSTQYLATHILILWKVSGIV